ncbi:MAG: SCO family protein [Myxococcales bacterium]|nr:SCO family protein [Myxococcales bacterium]
MNKPANKVGKYAIVAVLASTLTGGPAWALGPKSGTPPGAGTKQEDTTADAVLGRISIDQKLGEQIPLDLEFTDASGKTRQLGDLLGPRPLVLALVYYECPMLCTMVLNGMLRALNVLKFDAGKEFDILTISIDPRETPVLAAEKKAIYLKRYRRAGSERGWRFFVGTQSAITALSDAVGFRYVYVKETDQYAHASGLVILTPEGKVSKYLYGIDYSPRDLRLSLVEASAGRIGSFTDAILLSCFQYNPSEGRYSFAVISVIRLVGILTVLAILSFIIMSRVHERRRKTSQKSESSRPATESGNL